MTLGLYDFGEGGKAATEWKRKHNARLRKLERQKISQQKKKTKAEDEAELKIRLAAYRKKRKELRRLGLSCKGLPPRINKSQIIDIVGQRFGRLTVIRMAPRSESRGRNRCCYVKCDCPRRGIYKVAQTNLRQGLTHSCGCLTIEAQRARKGEKRGKPLSVKLLLEAKQQRAKGNVRVARLLEKSAPAVRINERKKARKQNVLSREYAKTSQSWSQR